MATGRSLLWVALSCTVVTTMGIPLDLALQQAFEYHSNREPIKDRQQPRFKRNFPVAQKQTPASLSASSTQVQNELEWEKSHPLLPIKMTFLPSMEFSNSWDKSSEYQTISQRMQLPMAQYNGAPKQNMPPAPPPAQAQSQNQPAQLSVEDHAFTDAGGQKPVYDNSREVRFSGKSAKKTVKRRSKGASTHDFPSHRFLRTHSSRRAYKHPEHKPKNLAEMMRFTKHRASSKSGHAHASQKLMWHGWLRAHE